MGTPPPTHLLVHLPRRGQEKGLNGPHNARGIAPPLLHQRGIRRSGGEGREGVLALTSGGRGWAPSTSSRYMRSAEVTTVTGLNPCGGTPGHPGDPTPQLNGQAGALTPPAPQGGYRMETGTLLVTPPPTRVGWQAERGERVPGPPPSPPCLPPSEYGHLLALGGGYKAPNPPSTTRQPPAAQKAAWGEKCC